MAAVFGWSNGAGQMLINAGRGVIMGRDKRFYWIQGDAFGVILLKVLFISQVVQQIGFDIESWALKFPKKRAREKSTF